MKPKLQLITLPPGHVFCRFPCRCVTNDFSITEATPINNGLAIVNAEKVDDLWFEGRTPLRIFYGECPQCGQKYIIAGQQDG